MIKKYFSKTFKIFTLICLIQILGAINLLAFITDYNFEEDNSKIEKMKNF